MFQPLRQVGDQVLRVFEADMDAHERALGLPGVAVRMRSGYAGWMRLSKPPQLAPMPNRSSASIIA